MTPDEHPSGTTVPVAFYAVSDRRHFIGFVALLNSLRLVGHDEPVFLVDAGLSPDQRERLATHVSLIEAPTDVHVIFLKQHGPTQRPAQVMVLLDSDVIVVRSLSPLIACARRGKLVAFMDNEPDDERFFEEWAKLLSLDEVRRHPYVNAGQLVLPIGVADRVLGPWTDGQMRINPERTWYATADRQANPLYFGDQDVLNAVVGSALGPGELEILENRLAPNPPFAGLRLIDAGPLHCEYADGTQPFILHHFLAKPWLATTPANVYSRLLTRLLLSPDVAVRLSPELLPLRLREGRIAALDRFRASCQSRAYTGLRRRLGRLELRTQRAARRGGGRSEPS